MLRCTIKKTIGKCIEVWQKVKKTMVKLKKGGGRCLRVLASSRKFSRVLAGSCKFLQVAGWVVPTKNQCSNEHSGSMQSTEHSRQLSGILTLHIVPLGARWRI